MSGYKPKTDVVHHNMKRDPKDSSYVGLMWRYRNKARKKNRQWSIELDDFKTLVNGKCHWCGQPPAEKYNAYISKNGYTQRKHASYTTENGWITYNGIDRFDNDHGYVLGNVVPCCKQCNTAKNVLSSVEFLHWLHRIGKNQLFVDSHLTVIYADSDELVEKASEING